MTEEILGHKFMTRCFPLSSTSSRTRHNDDVVAFLTDFACVGVGKKKIVCVECVQRLFKGLKTHSVSGHLSVDDLVVWTMMSSLMLWCQGSMDRGVSKYQEYW